MNNVELFEAFREIAKTLKEAWGAVIVTVQSITDAVSEAKKKNQRVDYVRSTWTINFDTRKVSQVLNRKPLFAIQKII